MVLDGLAIRFQALILLSNIFASELRSVAATHLSNPSIHASRQASQSCFPVDPVATITQRMNALLNVNATNYSLQLCPDTEYVTTAPIVFSANGQEITTMGFPGLDLSHRAIITVNGSTANDGTGHTTAVNDGGNACSSVALRYVQINGNRGSSILQGGANIEFGGANQNQVVEYVHSYNPRGWSCLHIAEGPFTCANALIQNNDIGPCGTDKFLEWSDGISLSCQTSIVQNNVVDGATDGGIVVFGSPGSRIHNNTIRVGQNIQLGGINLVDWAPWKGNYTDTVVENNYIFGGFATNLTDPSQMEGKNVNDTFIKIGIAMGVRTWFGEKYPNETNFNALVRNNTFQGAFGFAMGASTVNNFTVYGNTVDTDVTFVGSKGPNCSTTDLPPPSGPFVFNSTSITNSIMDQAFVDRDVDSLTCVVPANGDFWPFLPTTTTTTTTAPTATGTSSPTGTSGSPGSISSSSTKASSVPLAVGLTVGIIGAALVAFGVRWWYRRKTDWKRITY